MARSLRWPSLLLCVLIGVYAVIDADVLDLPHRTTHLVYNTLHAALVLTATLVAARLIQSSVEHVLRQKKLLLPGTGVLLALIRVIVWGIGLLVLLKGIGVEITPILTALGIGGLAVSLALQDTLANFFAGIQIVMDKPVALGDRVRLESGQEGWVESIGWRSTRLRTDNGDLVVIPNSKLVQSVIYKYSRPRATAETSAQGGSSRNRASA